MASASILLMNTDKKNYDEQILPMFNHINVGSDKDITIKELAETLKEVVGFKGKINFDLTKLDGNPRKILNSQRIKNLGFKPKMSLKEGLIKTYQDFIKS